MFVAPITDDDCYTETIMDSFKSSYSNSPDIISAKRIFNIHGGVNLDKFRCEGVHRIGVTIINTAVLCGQFHIDTKYNPDSVLVKTIYHGTINVPADVLGDNSQVHPEMLAESTLMLDDAYTSVMGLFPNNLTKSFVPLASSILCVKQLNKALKTFDTGISIYTDGDMVMKLEMSVDGDQFNVVLPIPSPQFYSRHHAQVNREEPIISKSERLDPSKILDENTEFNMVDLNIGIPIFDDGLSRTKTHGVTYIDTNGKEIAVSRDRPDDIFIPVHQLGYKVINRAEQLFNSIVKTFNRYQLEKLVLIKRGDKLITPTSMEFSYDIVPKGFVKTVINDILDNNLMDGTFEDMSMVLDGDVDIVCRMDNMRFDIMIIINTPIQKRPDLKKLYYSRSFKELMTSATDNYTSISSPISMVR